MQLRSLVRGNENLSLGCQYAAKLRWQDEIGSSSVLWDEVQIRHVEQLTQLVFGLHGKKLHISKVAIASKKISLERAIPGNNKVDPRITDELLGSLEYQMQGLLGANL